jgi:hypothetical protein
MSNGNISRAWACRLGGMRRAAVVAIPHYAAIFFAGSKSVNRVRQLRNDLALKIRRPQSLIRAIQTSARYDRGESSRETERVRNDRLAHRLTLAYSSALISFSTMQSRVSNSVALGQYLAVRSVFSDSRSSDCARFAVAGRRRNNNKTRQLSPLFADRMGQTIDGGFQPWEVQSASRICEVVTGRQRR